MRQQHINMLNGLSGVESNLERAREFSLNCDYENLLEHLEYLQQDATFAMQSGQRLVAEISAETEITE